VTEPSERSPSTLSEQEVFRRRTVMWLVAIGVASFAGAFAIGIFADDVVPQRSADADAFSYSAIGHRGLVETLRRLDVPVVMSTHDSAAKLGAAGALVIAEPIVYDQAGRRADALRDMVADAERVLVVLPKLYGVPAALRPTWVEDVGLLAPDEVAAVARLAGIDGEIVRPEALTPFESSLGAAPELVVPQLIVSEKLEPVVASAGGILVGVHRDGGRAVWVLADPDVISNHGLRRGDNALLAVALIDALRGDAAGGLVIDETLHGYVAEPSLWRALFEFPLVLATLSTALALAVLVWAAIGRFGKPEPTTAALAPGKAFLIDNTAALLYLGRHGGHSLARYLDHAVRDVAAALHVPAGLDASARERWLERVGAARGVSVRLPALRREVERARTAAADGARQTVDAARRIHRWRQEMTDGARDA
jgi:hypothetical protein